MLHQRTKLFDQAGRTLSVEHRVAIWTEEHGALRSAIMPHIAAWQQRDLTGPLQHQQHAAAWLGPTSVVTLKPAIHGHFKTGQLDHHGLVSCQAMFSIEPLLGLKSRGRIFRFRRMNSERCLWTFYQNPCSLGQ